jgi:hypothetical protein
LVSLFSSDQQPGLPGHGHSLAGAQFHRLLVHTQNPSLVVPLRSMKALLLAAPQGTQSARAQASPKVGSVAAWQLGIVAGSA